MDSSTVICWTSPFVILRVSSLFCRFNYIFDGNNVDPNQRHIMWRLNWVSSVCLLSFNVFPGMNGLNN